MTVEFLVLDTKYYDGTESGYNKVLQSAVKITVKDALNIEDTLKHYRKKYPSAKYDFDDVKWE